MIQTYNKVAVACSKLTTKAYSTSFSIGIKLLDKSFHEAIYSIYGFVRFADEIVDTFHDQDKKKLLDKFRKDTFEAIEDRISLNPILHSFQQVYNTYNLDEYTVTTFLDSMEMDLDQTSHSPSSYETYILGSAEVVGLMCLKVFCNGNQKQYDELKPFAMKLGSAFQKINFLRDLKDDVKVLNRTYFPHLDMRNFSQKDKEAIEKEIEEDFEQGLIGIKKLPKTSRFGVYVAYMYFRSLLNKIKKEKTDKLLEERIRISNFNKYILLLKSFYKYQLNKI